MTRWRWAVYTCIAIAVGVATAADQPRRASPGDDPGATQPAVTRTAAAPAAAEPSSQRKECLKACDNADASCNTEVRRARQQCSKNAANQGRDPYTMRNDEYVYFCSHFRDTGRCGSSGFGRGCEARFSERLSLCIDVMQKNVASMRYDCYRNERDAQGLCREELRDCKAECGRL